MKKRPLLVFVDDTDDGPEFAALLKASGTMRCITKLPPELPSPDTILAVDPDIVLVDFDLARRQPDGVKATYTGAAFAASIRDKAPAIPVVLVSRGALGKRLESRRDLSSGFDELIYKEEIKSDPRRVVRDLVELISGYQVLARTSSLRWTDLLDILGADGEAELEELRLSAGTAGPRTSNQQWRVSEAAHWIRGVVLAYPGILLDELYAATLLGVDLQSFSNKRLQSTLATARYTGPFAQKDYWWKTRLLALISKRFAKAGTAGPPQAFVDNWNASQQADKLRRANCVYSKTEVADSVCWVLRRPVKREFSLPYQPDGRPQVMDEARVSFKAIAESAKFREELVPLAYRQLVDARQRGRRARK